MGYKYVFGPVVSGRIGRSLGLDLLGKRICSMDCVYCEVGATDFLVTERKVYVPAADILEELERWKQEGLLPPEIVTLGGLGEPTLNSELPEIISGVKRIFPSTPVAVLTNATTMTNPEVRRELMGVDVILPSMDSLVMSEFRAINRPYKGTDPDGIARALIELRKEFKGKIFLEILLSRGYNDSDANLSKMKEFCSVLSPDRIDVVTLSRPGTLEKAVPVDTGTLDHWKKVLDAAPCKSTECGSHKVVNERICPDDPTRVRGGDFGAFDRIQASLMRRPQTAQQLSTVLDISPRLVEQIIEELKNSGGIIIRKTGDETYYKCMPDD